MADGASVRIRRSTFIHGTTDKPIMVPSPAAFSGLMHGMIKMNSLSAKSMFESGAKVPPRGTLVNPKPVDNLGKK